MEDDYFPGYPPRSFGQILWDDKWFVPLVAIAGILFGLGAVLAGIAGIMALLFG